MAKLINLPTEFYLTPETVSTIEQLLKEKLQSRVEQAYFFGSVANGTYKKNSDIDLILIKDTNVKFTNRAIEFIDLFDIFPRMDMLVYTPKEFADNLQNCPNGFWRALRQQKRPILLY